ncbi:hypothetical protein [Sulfurospirillum arcachonense]|uniref:hypothetical protein n=1 Tax=Sulfurospirillum arcachonense TaxID=57666 RepID=UPI0004698165|nr:hypothetical protein [Sulfurospirillum arcachonense]
MPELKTRIDELENVCNEFLKPKEEEEKTKEGNSVILLKIKAFNEIIRDCKNEINSSDKEHMEHVLKILFSLVIDKENIKNTDYDLESFINSQINGDFATVNEKRILSLKNIISNVDSVIEILAIEYKNLVFINKKWYRFKRRELKRYEEHLTRLMSLKEKLEIQLENDSKIISFSIIENFYNSYIFFSFLINLSILERREILLIEVANSIDRYIDVIEPSFNKRLLQHQDMIYHYAIYELKELKNKVFTYLKD